MAGRSWIEEARQCRAWAEELDGRPESAVLLRIAHEFDFLAQRGPPCGFGRRRANRDRVVPLRR